MTTHTCHALGCRAFVAPKLLMCGKHWRMVPPEIQRQVWATYRSGQEVDKNPSFEYIQAQKRAVAAVAQLEGRT